MDFHRAYLFGIAEFAGLEIAGLENGGLENDGLENDGLEFGGLKNEGLKICKLTGHWQRHIQWITSNVRECSRANSSRHNIT